MPAAVCNKEELFSIPIKDVLEGSICWSRWIYKYTTEWWSMYCTSLPWIKTDYYPAQLSCKKTTKNRALFITSGGCRAFEIIDAATRNSNYYYVQICVLNYIKYVYCMYQCLVFIEAILPDIRRWWRWEKSTILCKPSSNATLAIHIQFNALYWGWKWHQWLTHREREQVLTLIRLRDLTEGWGTLRYTTTIHTAYVHSFVHYSIQLQMVVCVSGCTTIVHNILSWTVVYVIIYGLGRPKICGDHPADGNVVHSSWCHSCGALQIAGSIKCICSERAGMS